ncbi:MAG: hypothetical protein AAB327_07755, partial [Actinomycetota bacterium]
MTVPSPHRVAILGELGNGTTIESVRSSILFEFPIEIIELVFASSLANDVESVAADLLICEPTAIFIGSDVPADFAFVLARRLLSLSPTTEIVLVNTVS